MRCSMCLTVTGLVSPGSAASRSSLRRTPARKRGHWLGGQRLGQLQHPQGLDPNALLDQPAFRQQPGEPFSGGAIATIDWGEGRE